MSTGQTWKTASTSSEDTFRLAEKIGSKLQGGEVIQLVSDLGGGKTTFIRGLTRGAGSSDPVHSPSFTLGNEYCAPNLTIYHFDFYRLEEPGIMRDELTELLSDPKAVVAMEWGSLVKNVLPQDRIIVTIKPTGLNSREIIFKYADQFKYLIGK